MEATYSYVAMKWRVPTGTREGHTTMPSQMVMLLCACKEEHDKYNTKWSGKGLCREQSFSPTFRTSLCTIGTMLSGNFPPSHHLHSLPCCRPAHSSSIRSHIHPERNVPAGCDTCYWARHRRESGKRDIWDVINRSSCTSLLVHNSMHVKYRK